ncbi:MAG: class II aldolase/adducin family protein [Desulfobacteraceae bacterium]|nr:class II aldolase/adducin family protein [Desulfobacteraceae bacterium]
MTQYDQSKKDVLAACLWLSEHGYFGSQRGSGGNVSVRGDGAAMVITPSSLPYHQMSPNDLFVLGLDLAMIEGQSSLKPSVEAGMHSVIYRHRPDVNAVVHTHQTFGSVFALLNAPIPALFDEVAFALGSMVEIIPYALSGSQELVNNVETKLANHANAYVIQNHGILALGKNLEKAILHAELLEKIAQVYCLALSTGKPVSQLPQAVVDLVKAMRDHEVKQAGGGKA